MNIYEKLNAARHEFHGQEIKKSGLNKFAGYKYFELADFVVPALKIFNSIGITPVIKFGKEQATMELVNTSKPEESILFSSPMSEANLKGCHPVQNLGAVETYIRRYLWVCALEIVEHDALDSSEPEKTMKSASKQIIQAAVSMLDAAASTSDNAKTLESWTDMADELKKLVWPELHDMTKTKIKELRGAK